MCNVGDRLFCSVSSHNYRADVAIIGKFMCNIGSTSKVVIVTDATKKDFKLFAFTRIIYFVISVWHEMDKKMREKHYLEIANICVHNFQTISILQYDYSPMYCCLATKVFY